MTTGSVLYLNGPSSSGKHSIVTALQELLDEPWFSIGIDTWFAGFPRHYIGDEPPADQGFPWEFDANGELTATRTGLWGRRLMRGLYATTAALADTGNNVIVDDVMMEAWMPPACARVLTGHHAYLIGVHCRLDITEARERARGNRPSGLARCNHHLVHQHGVYDFEVDTSDISAGDCARAIKAFLQEGHPPHAFRSLATMDWEVS